VHRNRFEFQPRDATRGTYLVVDGSFVPPNSDNLQQFVVAIARDTEAPVPIRNACHLLMIAIERNDLHLVNASLSELHRIAELESYELPQL
jgi:hypothetical protein